MKKYYGSKEFRVDIGIDMTYSVDVNADNVDEAIDLAYNSLRRVKKDIPTDLDFGETHVDYIEEDGHYVDYADEW